MLAQQRQEKILELVNLEGSISTDTLEKELSVSTMTIWRDLRELEQKGEIRRVHGGAIRAMDHEPAELSFQKRKLTHKEEKLMIARFAAERFVEPNDIITLHSGTTVAAMLPFITHPNVTVLTDGLLVMQQETHASNLTLVCSGGIYRTISQTFVGPQVEAFFKEHNARKVFLSTEGFSIEKGATDPSPLESKAKQSMLETVDKTYLLMDSSKFHVRSLVTSVPLENVDVLITDSGAPEDMISSLRECEIEVYIVQKTRPSK